MMILLFDFKENWWWYRWSNYSYLKEIDDDIDDLIFVFKENWWWSWRSHYSNFKEIDDDIDDLIIRI